MPVLSSGRVARDLDRCDPLTGLEGCLGGTGSIREDGHQAVAKTLDVIVWDAVFYRREASARMAVVHDEQLSQMAAAARSG